MKTSVALCTYNGEKFLKKQIDSILQQTKKIDEIVVCDDQSTDSTMRILEEYDRAHPHLFKIYINEVNLRSVKNFEKAIQLCTNEIIFLSDQDDIWLENKVEKYCEFFENHPEIDVLASNGFGIDEHDRILEVYSLWDIPIFLREKNKEVNYFDIITYCGNIVTGASVAFRKKLVEKIIPFPVIKDFHHDEWIALHSTIANSFYMFEEKYFKYRIHDSQQVGNVFVEKNKEQKDRLIKYFDFSMQDDQFSSYKKMLKRVIKLIEKNENFLTIENYNKIAFQVKKDLFKKYGVLRKEMKEKYPIQNYILSITDKILNKRQLNIKQSE